MSTHDAFKQQQQQQSFEIVKMYLFDHTILFCHMDTMRNSQSVFKYLCDIRNACHQPKQSNQRSNGRFNRLVATSNGNVCVFTENLKTLCFFSRLCAIRRSFAVSLSLFSLRSLNSFLALFFLFFLFFFDIHSACIPRCVLVYISFVARSHYVLWLVSAIQSVLLIYALSLSLFLFSF